MLVKLKSNQIISKVHCLLEMAFLIISGLYLMWRTLLISQFDLKFPGWLEDVLLYSLIVLAAMRVIFIGVQKWQAWIGLLVSLAYCLVFYSDGYNFLLALAALTVGYYGIDYRKILKTWICAVGSVAFLAIIAALTGTINNYIYFEDGIRSSWGLHYPTDMAALILFVLMMLWILKYKVSDWVLLILSILSILISRFIANSSTSLICGIIFTAAIIYFIFTTKQPQKHTFFKRLDKVVDAFVMVSFPLFALVFFVLMLLYNRGIGLVNTINELMNGRISLAVDAWQEYGLTAFGTPFSMRGNGGTPFQISNYNFVDSSYPLILIRYGVVIFLVICVVWGWLARKSIRSGNRRIAIVMGILAFASFSEHHFIEVHYNILLAMPFAMYAVPPSAKEFMRSRNKKTTRFNAAYGIIICLLSVALGPSILTRLKTAFEVLNLQGGGNKSWAVIGILIAIFGATFFALWAIYKVLIPFFREDISKGRKAPITILSICAAVFIVGFLLSNSLVYDVINNHDVALLEEQDVMETILSTAQTKVYADSMPQVYQQYFDGISNSVFSGEELARCRGTTVIMDVDTEYNAFFESGFLYTPISDAHAVYTDDKAVKQALTDAGYHLTGYYPAQKYVDLDEEAQRNNLVSSESVGMELYGTEHSLRYGPYVGLYKGKYTVTYELELPEDNHDVDADYFVCWLCVCSDSKEKIWQSQNIFRDQFDEEGRLTVDLTCNFWKSAAYVEFLALTGDGRQVNVKSISYQRTPDYDIHYTYDKKLREIYREYYSVDGEPVIYSDNYFTRELRYDKNGNIDYEAYYDTQGNPTCCCLGYSAIHRIYNDNKKIIREDYYGTDGNAAVLPSGYSTVQYDYDNQGNIIVYRYYDAEGEFVITDKGYAQLKRIFDEDNNLIYQGYFDADGNPCYQSAGFCSIEQRFDDEGNRILRRYLDKTGNLIQRSDGYSEVRWEYDAEGVLQSQNFYDQEENLVNDEDLNLAIDNTTEWSEWMTPKVNTSNSTFTISSVLLGEKQIGDFYTCQMEIEFHGVSATENESFKLLAQGAVDHTWSGKANIWNRNLVYFNEAPADGTYLLTSTVQISDSNVDAQIFDIGFRCDNWASGSFRVGHVKIEKGDVATSWDPGL